MKNLKLLTLTILLSASGLLLSACNTVRVYEPEHGHGHEHRGYGPPPHAPAHGYRHKHHHHTLEYDYDLGVYIVIGLIDHYFIDGVYYKHTSHGWYTSYDGDRDWREYHNDRLPGKLDRKYGHDKKYGKKDKHRKENGQGRKNRHDDDDYDD